jgi:diacylglycerol kinase (ATP)
LKGNTGIKRIVLAAGYSAQGLKAAFVNEAAFRQEVVLAVILIPLACWFDITMIERVLMIAAVFLVLIVELLNSAIEAVVDRIGPEKHELSGRAKDIGSAAVLLALLLTIYIWGEVLWPKLFN